MSLSTNGKCVVFQTKASVQQEFETLPCQVHTVKAAKNYSYIPQLQHIVPPALKNGEVSGQTTHGPRSCASTNS